jgi:hypothetical protein
MTRMYILLLFIVILSSCEKGQDKNDTILKFYGDALEDIGYSVAKAGDGYFIAGQLTQVARTGSGGNIIDDKNSVKKLGIIKTDANGNVIWKKSFGDKVVAAGSKILALDDGSVICTGYVVDSVKLEKDIFVVKTDADGTGTLQKIYKSAGNQYGTDILKTQEGFLILGTTDIAREPLSDSTGNESGQKDILLVRINNNLDVISTTAVGFPKNDEGVAIKSDINGGYIVVATTQRSIPRLNQAGYNVLLLRINADGSSTQLRILGGLDNEYVADIEVLNDGYLIAGTIGNEGPDQRGYVWKISGNIYAEPLFAHKIEIETTTTAAVSFSVKAISRYKTNSFVMAGQSGTGSSAKMLIFVTDADGYQVAGKKKIIGGTALQTANDVISDEDDNIVAVGKNSYGINSMISFLKFRF